MGEAAKKAPRTLEQMPDFLTVDELAEVMRWSVWTAYRALEAGKIGGAQKLTGGWRINKQALLESFRAEARVVQRKQRLSG